MSQNRLTTTVHELAPGKRVAPYQYQHGNEEWALVLDGHLEPAVTCYPDDGTLRVTPPGKVFREADALASDGN